MTPYVFPLLLTAHTVLEAPALRDDFYCSVLAYSTAVDLLAVGIGTKVWLWSEAYGVSPMPWDLDALSLLPSHVTSMSFSSEPGQRAILAVARSDGGIALWSPRDDQPRLVRINHPAPATHVSFRPIPICCPSQQHAGHVAEHEVMLAGDDRGAIWVYLVEWPSDDERSAFGRQCGAVRHARILIHSQQICGLGWSPDGEYFASGGNDNTCSLVETRSMLHAGENQADIDGADFDDGILFGRAHVKHQWKLGAAVKALAFCPWQSGLLAVGGGSNDRRIHFYHTVSGACLATIDCAAQVTSLTWSSTRREIAATFGFAQPEHPFRIAVYSWPSCQQVVAIPWLDDMRALYAVHYPRGPSGRCGVPEPGRHPPSGSRREDGCLAIAASDGSVKFHEVWSESNSTVGASQGLLGGSAVLESLHGFERDGPETIR